MTNSTLDVLWIKCWAVIGKVSAPNQKNGQIKPERKTSRAREADGVEYKKGQATGDEDGREATKPELADEQQGALILSFGDNWGRHFGGKYASSYR